MAWTSPATVGGGQMIDATWMNTYVRDNLLALDQHAHGGAAGDGSADLDVTEVRLDNVSDPSAPGAGLTVIATRVSDGTLRQRAGASGSIENLAVEGHTH